MTAILYKAAVGGRLTRVNKRVRITSGVKAGQFTAELVCSRLLKQMTELSITRSKPRGQLAPGYRPSRRRHLARNLSVTGRENGRGGWVRVRPCRWRCPRRHRWGKAVEPRWCCRRGPSDASRCLRPYLLSGAASCRGGIWVRRSPSHNAYVTFTFKQFYFVFTYIATRATFNPRRAHNQSDY